MRNGLRLAALAALLVLIQCASCLAEEAEWTDFAGQVALDMNSDTVKQVVSVRTFVDGDTTHFNVPESVEPTGVLKARYIACNAPESTGKIEEWGKAASRFTREKLESAEEILIESDTNAWNPDSTSTRYLVWVWYRPVDEDTFRNLNVELLQEGLAIANSSAQNRYGDVCMAAIAQARANALRVYSDEKDPDFFYGDAIELTIRELRLNPEAYDGKKVAFSGVITLNHNNAVFLEAYDEETGLYYGFSAYYGFNMSGAGLDVLTVGNEARIVGTVQYYEAGQTWQVSGLTYRMMKPDDPGNIQIISTGQEPSWKDTTPDTLCGAVEVELDDGAIETREYAELALDTSVSVTGLTVQSQVTGEHRFRLYCFVPAGDAVIGVPVEVEGDAPGDLTGKTIDARGIVDYNNGYFVHVYTADGLTIRDE